MRERAAELAALLRDADSYFYVCGLKSMEEDVVLALRDIADEASLRWETLGAADCTWRRIKQQAGTKLTQIKLAEAEIQYQSRRHS
jgi:sulfite reductase alpha subunit-like flavoprotein